MVLSTPLLLDTHALVWAVGAPDRLSAAARDAISDPGRPLLVSAASAWEMAIKYRSGRWPQVEPLLDGYEDVLAELGAGQRVIGAADAIRAGGLAWSHADPFDRMLAAQALGDGVALVTLNPRFEEVAGLQILW